MKYIQNLILIISVSFGFGQNQLIIPDTLNTLEPKLILNEGIHQFYEGVNTNTMGANGGILGPTLIFNQGEYVDISVENLLEDTTTIHWHGMHVSAENDGGPHTTIAPNANWNPSFTVLDKAGTYWYHPHLHKKTNEHVTKGIAGFIIVRDSEESMLDLPRKYGIDDFPLAIQTKNIDSDKQIVFPSNTDSVIMVNATIDAELSVPAQIVRFRLLNGSSQRVYNIGLSNSKEFYQIGSDGGLLNEPILMNRLMLTPGERAEVLVGFSGMEGQIIELISYASEIPNGIFGATNPGVSMGMGFGLDMDGYDPNPLNGTDFKIMQIRIGSSTNNPTTSIPSTLVNVVPILESESNIIRTLTLSPEMGNMGPGMGMDVLNGNFLINNQSFDMDVINYEIPFNNTEIWSITNMSPIGHPFHIHDVQFYILDRNGNPPPVNERGRKDVVFVNPMETVRFITKFEDFTNSPVPYMYHCHMLRHEDDGMMGQFTISGSTVSIEDDIPISIPSTTSIESIYPNPFNPQVTINYNLSIANHVQVTIYDLTGNMINELESSYKQQGSHSLYWNGVDQNGMKAPGGIYLVRINTGNVVKTSKMLFLK